MPRQLRLVALALSATVTVLSLSSVAGAASDKTTVALARKALITRSDFPAGWTTTSSAGNSNSAPGVRQMASCLHVPANEVNYNPPTANSPSFNFESEGLEVDDSVEIFPNKEIGSEQFEIYGSPRSGACMDEAFNSASGKASMERGIGAGAKVGKIVASKLPNPNETNESTALEFHIPFTYKNQAYATTVTMVVIMSTSMKEGAELVFTSALGAPFPASLVSHLEAVTAQRLG